MPEPRMTFSARRRLLSDLGFREVPAQKSFIGFQHEDQPDTWFVLPAYRGNAPAGRSTVTFSEKPHEMRSHLVPPGEALVPPLEIRPGSGR